MRPGSRAHPPRAAGAAAFAAVFFALLGGCAVGPDYQRPATPDVPAAYDGATNGWKVAEPRAQLPKGDWWEVFGDEPLNRLEAGANASNQRLRAAVAAFQQARAFLDVGRAGFFPHAQLAPYAMRQRDSANRPINGVSNGKPVTYNTFSIPLDLNYEVDVWGRVRRIAESARADAEAGAADLAAVRLAIQAEVANYYFTLRALDAEIALLRSSVDVFQKSLELTRNRRAGGIATDLDVSQAETVLKTTEAQIPATLLLRARSEHALAALTGRLASGYALPESGLTLQPPVLPPGVPSELLERRPDISAAERRMAAANAGIGIAKAAFFPTLQLNGAAGLESIKIGRAHV